MQYRIGMQLFGGMIIGLFQASVFAATAVLPIQQWQTTKGAQVYFVRRPEIPMVDIQLVFAAGSVQDGSQWGLANLVNAMLNEGTQQHTANQLAVAFGAVGAELNGSVNRDMALVSLRSVTDSQYLQPALRLFAEIVTQAHFPERALQRVKKQIETDIRESQQQPLSVALDTFYKTLYGDTPYGHPVWGTVNRVAQLTRAQVMRFYRHYYVARNTDVILVGDITREKAKQIAEALTQGLPAGVTATALTPATPRVSTQRHISFPAEQSSIILGQIAVARQNPDYFPLMVGNQILGGDTMTSILFNAVRNDRGLVYGIASQFDMLRDRGPFAIVLQTRAAKAAEALRVIQEAVTTFITQGPTAEQLQAAQRNMVGSFPLQIAKNSQIESVVTRMAFYHLPLDYLDRYSERVNAVTAAHIQQAFTQWLDPQQMTTVIVGPSR